MIDHRTSNDRLAELGGADLNILERVPRDRNMFARLAVVMMFTAALAMLSMSFAMHDGVKASWPVAVAIGLFWGLLVFNLDRLLVVSMNTCGGRGSVLMMAIPRLAMAALISLVVSTPLVLRVFASDIEAQLYSDQLQASADLNEGLAATQENHRADDLAEKIAEYKAVLAGDLGEVTTSPTVLQAQATVESLTSALDDAQAKRDDARRAWQCERQGAGAACHGASDGVGDGPLAAVRKTELDEAQVQVDDLSARLTQARTALDQALQASASDQQEALAAAQEEAERELPGLQAEYDALVAQVGDLAERGSTVTRADTGLLAQLRALSEIGARDATLDWAHLALVALFFAVEMAPVLVKLLIVLAGTEYESALRTARLIDDDLRELDRETERQIAEGRARTRREIEDDMRERELEFGKPMNEHVAGHVASRTTEIIDANLTRWDAEVRASLAQFRATPPPVAPASAVPLPAGVVGRTPTGGQTTWTPPWGTPAAAGSTASQTAPVLGNPAFI